MNIMIINGPGLDMLGVYRTELYGAEDYDELCFQIDQWAEELGFGTDIRQSNYEGEIIEYIHNAFEDDYEGVIINPAAFGQYSYAIRDALLLLKCPVVEVYIPDITKREALRGESVLKDICAKQIYGKGFEGYKEALQFFFDIL